VLSYLEAAPDGEARGTLLCLHGYPESGHMFSVLVARAAQAGWRALAPDLPGYGDSEPDPPHTWTRMVDAVDRFHGEHAGGPVALCVHDWGGLIGLRWACDHSEKVSALVISATGFFPDGKWHGLAQAMRTEGQGEEIVDGATRASFGQMLAAVAPGIDEAALDHYFKAYGDPVRRHGQLELYRSGDFSELEPYRGRLAALDVPTLLLFGSEDPFAPVASAHRFAKEIPHARLEILDGVGHFLFDEVPDWTSGIVLDFLGQGSVS
jgi:pimeloyl-ACP methyl ester carboxylesterase